ncbi:MAG: MBL fold metallo-hydrolase [Acidobacteriaceae bacterium]|nr:MBL fold metallo-hydrolase [Acidobacteriaceae bacterium]
MTNELLYLRQNIQLEPLIDQWYAWSHLISPATAARNITERHFKIMDSYINAPQIHANAVKNPKMLGGPFIDYDGKRVDEIRALRDRTRRDRAHLVALSTALAELDGMLRANAKGYSLHSLYDKVPAMLKGFVELQYDLNNQASYRLIEPLLYRSRYYDKTTQSLMLSRISGDDRPFVLSTPRLEGDGLLHLKLPFDDPRVDELFELKKTPRTWSSIRDMFDLSEPQADLFRGFFTEEAPPPYRRYEGDGLLWRYFGHACIMVETKNVSMLFDPVLSYTYESSISRYTYLDIPDRLDFVLITHNHQDHILFETLLQLRNRIGTIIVPRSGSGALEDPSVKLTLENCGFKNVIELREMESVPIQGGSITGLPFFGEHSDLAINTKLAYLVRVHGESFLFAADSCNIEPALYKHVHNSVGDVRALFLGMECDGAPMSWVYGPLQIQRLERGMDESRRLSGSNCEQGMGIVEAFNCREAYVYAMGQEPWLNYVMSLKYTEQSRPIVDSNRLIETCRSRGMCAERLFGEKEILLEGGAAREQPRIAKVAAPQVN